MRLSIHRVKHFTTAVAVLAAVSLSGAPATAQVGRGCSAFKPCGKGFSCQPIAQKCYNSPRQENQPCSAGFSCGVGLRCTPFTQRCESVNAPLNAAIEQAGKATTALFTGRLMLNSTTSAPQQCIYNQSGYAATVRWYRKGDLTFTKSGDSYTLNGAPTPFRTDHPTLGFRTCVGERDGVENTAIVTVKDGKVARTVAIIAVDVGSVAATVGCYGGAAALTVATAGAGAVAMVGCEVVTDIAVGIIADPSIIPDAKELVGVVKPPVDLSTKHWEVIMYGTVWDPKWRIGTP